MAFTPIQLGQQPDDGKGTTLRGGGQIINDNFVNAQAQLDVVFNGGNAGNIIYVSQGETATDTRTGLSAYDAYNPFATPEAAVAVAVAGDSVFILPGDYALTSSILKDGVNIFTYPGVTGTLTGNNRNSIFSDLDGAKTCIIGGYADWIRDGYSLGGGTGEACVLQLTNPASNVKLYCNSLQQLWKENITGWTILQQDGTLYLEALEKITAAPASIEGNGTYNIEWQNGTGTIRTKLISGGTSASIISQGGDETEEHFNVYAETYIADPSSFGLLDNTNGSEKRIWINGNRAAGNVGASGGFSYVSLQKLDGNFSAQTGATAYLTAQKWQAYDSLIGGAVWIAVQEVILDNTGVESGREPLEISAGANAEISFKRATSAAGNCITLSGGTLRLSGALDSSADNTANPIYKSGGTLVLDGVIMVAEAGRACIEIPTNQTIIVYSARANTVVSTAHTVTQTVSTVAVSSAVI